MRDLYWHVDLSDDKGIKRHIARLVDDEVRDAVIDCINETSIWIKPDGFFLAGPEMDGKLVSKKIGIDKVICEVADSYGSDSINILQKISDLCLLEIEKAKKYK